MFVVGAGIAATAALFVVTVVVVEVVVSFFDALGGRLESPEKNAEDKDWFKSMGLSTTAVVMGAG